MSRRKQPNPNKVRLMDHTSEEKRAGEVLSSTPGAKATEQTDESESPAPTQARERHAGSPVEHGDSMEERGSGPLREDAGAEGVDGVDLSSIKSMMSTVMKAAQLNGGVEVTSTTPTKAPVKSPGVSRYTRKNQDCKDDTSSVICPLCDKNCQTQHQLTMHIRQHNSDAGATDHSCSICGKCLSSASSLDRHMLVHSGERPYRCTVCGQTFTTNGNMHRLEPHSMF